MAQSITITLTVAGPRTGPFNLYSNLDNYRTPFETGVSRTNLLAGYTSVLVPDGATIIRVVSTFDCISFVDLTIGGTTPTTTTSTTTTTTTAVPVRINWVNSEINSGIYLDSDLYINGSIQGGGVDGSGYVDVLSGTTVIVGQNSGTTSGTTGVFRLIIKDVTTPSTLYDTTVNTIVSEYIGVQTTNFVPQPGKTYEITASVRPPTTTSTTTTTTTISGTTTSTTTTTTTEIPTYTLLGPATIVGSTSCISLGSTSNIWLDDTDYAKYVANGGCFTNGAGSNTISTIRFSDGTAMSGTFYFVWYGEDCSYTTFKSTEGAITIRGVQC